MMDWDIEYPMIVLCKHGVRVERDSERLTTTQRSLLDAGVYNDRQLVDSVGRIRHLKEAREIGARLGPMGRLRYFWNPSRQIRVEFIFDSDITSVSVDELKERLLESFAGRPANMAAWNPGTINFEQFKVGLKSVEGFDEVFRLVQEFTTIRPELL